MDEENENWIFSDFEKKELSQDYIFTPFNEEDEKLGQSIEIDFTLKSRQASLDDTPIVNEYSGPFVKAFNPMEMVEKMAPQKQKQYLRLANNLKNFSGLQFVFQTEQYEQLPRKDNNFLQGINEYAFTYDQQPQSSQLSKLFSTHHAHQSQKQQILNLITQLRNRMNESQERSFNSIMINKTIGPAFYQHFENFSFVSNPSNFYQDLEANLTNFINHAKRIKGPGTQLIYSIYDFWMKTFKDFVNQIWKYSEKYTLSFLKKQKNSEVSDRSDSTARKQLLKQKRKNWGADEIRILQKIIESNVIFSQNKLKQLSEQLGRSINSISSKIQKIIKSKKGQQYQQDSLLKKTIEVLKLSPEGLIKESIIEKINEYYEMGYDGQWQKSVGQLLASRKEFNKVKGKYKLLGGQKYQKNKMDQENIQKMTFKDKVIKCLLRFQNYETELKSIVQMYIQLFGQLESVGVNNEQRRKSIEASISKTLSRYDIFETSNSKTIYQLHNSLVQNNDKSKTIHSQYEQLLSI